MAQVHDLDDAVKFMRKLFDDKDAELKVAADDLDTAEGEVNRLTDLVAELRGRIEESESEIAEMVDE